MKEIGTVVSLEATPNSNEFWFVVTAPEIRKGQLVQLNTKEGLLIGRIDEIIKYNRYYSSPESVSEFEKGGKSLTEHFPIDRWEYLIAKVTSLGIFSSTVGRITFPPSPGDKVFLADPNVISNFFGFSSEGLEIGELEFHPVKVKIDISRLFRKHLAILAMSGSGKSYLSSVLIEELLESQKPISIIVIDPHGEYRSFLEDKNYAIKTKVWRKGNLKIATHKLGVNTINEFIPQMSPQQRRDLKPIISELRKVKKVYGMDDLITAVEMSNIKSNTKNAILSWLEELNSSELFSNVDSPSLQELASPGKLSVIDLSDFIHLREKQIIVAYIARKLFEARRQKIIPPFILIVEEAHQFAPEREEASQAISKGIIEQIAREGRKFFASLVLITQRPVKLSTTALSQCNTQIIMRVTNPYDLQHIEESSEGISKEIIRLIPGLRVGEAFIVGEAVNFPVMFKVRERKSKASSISTSLDDELSTWGKEDKEIEEFFLS